MSLGFAATVYIFPSAFLVALEMYSGTVLDQLKQIQSNVQTYKGDVLT